MNRDERRKRECIKEEGEWDRIECGRRENREGGKRSGRKHWREERMPTPNTESQELWKGGRQRHCWDKRKGREGDPRGPRRKWFPAHLKGWTALQGERIKAKREERGEVWHKTAIVRLMWTFGKNHIVQSPGEPMLEIPAYTLSLQGSNI